MANWFQMPPGVATARTAKHRALFHQRSETMLAGGRIIDGTLSRDPGNTGDTNVLRIGTLMGKITATGKYTPSVFGVSAGAIAAGAVAVTIPAASAVELVRRVGATGTFKMTGPPAANGTLVTETVTYSAVDQVNGIVTISATTNAFVAGAFAQPTDGSETPLTMIPDTAGYGIPVTDIDGNSVSNVDFPLFPVSGIIASAQLLPWPADTSLQAWIIARLNNSFGGQYVFDSKY